MKVGRRIGRAMDVALFRIGQGPTRVARAIRDLVFGSSLYALTLRGRTPDAMRTPTTTPWAETDADRATLLAGFLSIGARRVPFEANPWPTLPDDETVRAVAHRFDWLTPLQDTAEGQALGNQLLTNWVAANPRWSAVAWRVDVLAERLALWSHWLPTHLASQADPDTTAAALKSFMAQARFLSRVGAKSPPEDWRAFAICRGLVRCGLSAPGGEACLAVGLRRLDAEIARQILPDGGHIQRCPSIHMRVLALLTDMRDALAAAHTEGPPALQNAIDKMAPMLRLFRLGDGGVSAVNGGHEETRVLVDSILERTQSKGKGMVNAPHTGFQRLAAGPLTIVADTGTPPPPGAQALAHAGTLAFEMSVGPHRMIVNCGAPRSNDPTWSQAMRATAAHSTVSIDDTNAVEFLPGGRIGVGPTEVHSQRRESGGTVWLDTEHNGYQSTLNMSHKRRFYLKGDGEDFRGEDVLSGEGGKTFRVRFHLHPQVQASLIKGGTGVLLRLPGGTGWRFFATGGTVSLEDSIYLGGVQRPRRTEQIIVSGLLDRTECTVKWRFTRVGA